METILDYVDWVAKSMFVDLDLEQLHNVTSQLIQHELYEDALVRLIEIISEEVK